MIILSLHAILDILCLILKNSFITYRKDIEIKEINQIETAYQKYISFVFIVEKAYKLEIMYYMEKDKKLITLKAVRIDSNIICNYLKINDLNINYFYRAKEAIVASTCGLSFYENELNEVINNEKNS